MGLYTREDIQAPLYGPEKQTAVASSLAANRAHDETIVLNEPESYLARKERNTYSNITDATISMLNREFKTQGILDTGQLDQEFDTPEELFESQKNQLQRLNYTDASATDVMLTRWFMAGAGNVPIEKFDESLRTLTDRDVAAARRNLIDMQGYRARREVDDLVAGLSFDGFFDAVSNVAVQDFLPGFNEGSRIMFNRELAQAAGVPLEGALDWVTGEIRQSTREHLVSLPPQEREAAIISMVDRVRELESTDMAPFLTKYNILESFESLLTEGVFTGLSAKNTMDRVISNAAAAMEVLYLGMVVKAVGRTVRGTTRASDALRARQIAKQTQQGGMVSQFDEEMLSHVKALEFGADPGAIVAVNLPKPAKFVDDMDLLPEGSKQVFHASERVSDEILETTDSITGLGLNKLDQANAIQREIAKLDMADGVAYLHPKMSALGGLPGDTGFRLDAVLGQTAEGGWKTFEDVVQDMLQLDPNGELFTIVRVNENGVLGNVFKDNTEFLRAAFKGDVPLAATFGPKNLQPEFYIRYQQDRFWHTVDKASFGPETFRNTGVVPKFVLSQNAKFGDEIYGNFNRAYIGEQITSRNLEIMFKPYYSLGIEDKRFVAGAFEWMEDFGKNNGRAPVLSEVVAHYDGISEAQTSGLVAMRTGMDTMHEIYNRRLFRDYQAQGFKTARPGDVMRPTYHGKSLERGQAKGGSYLDPDTGDIVKKTSKDLDDLYNSGGSVMKLDTAVDSAGSVKNKADQIWLGKTSTGYEVGDLSLKPLVYHPGYSFRFYDDPYFIIKETKGVTVNGIKRVVPNTEAIRTAGTQIEGERFVSRIEPEEGVRWEVKPARDIDMVESTLMQKQVIHQEGRLFWDKRNFDRLPDVNNNNAQLEDFTKALEKGTHLAARQTHGEDLMKSMKGAFENEYSDLVSKGDFQSKTMKEMLGVLRRKRRDTGDRALKKRINEAIDLVKYFRLMGGTDSALIPAMREGALNTASWVARTTGLKSKRVEKYFQSMDPTRTMRSIAFNAFMVFRPARQALMQSAQIGFLAPLDPLYIGSLKIFTDAFHLRRGIAKLRLSGFDDGYSIGRAAKAMGMSTKEYRHLIKQFDRSGIVDLADVHSFSGGAKRSSKVAIPKSLAGTVGYKLKQFGTGTKEAFQKWGFDLGERNNLTFTYLIALRREMKANKYKSVLSMKDKDWAKLQIDSSNLALGMVRPNNFGYQSGMASLGTQFLSFSHKAALSLIGKNPSLSNKETLQILFGTYLLYGGNMFGAEDFIRSQLTQMGIEDMDIPGIDGGTLVDYLASGLIETSWNQIFATTEETTKDLDLGFLAPGLDFNRLWEMNVRNIFNQPLKTIFGPFGGVFSKVKTELDFAVAWKNGNPDAPPTEKFTVIADAMMRGAFPQYSDLMRARIGYDMGVLYDGAGKPMPLRATLNALVARGLFGVSTREQMQFYNLENAIWENENQKREIIQNTRDFLILEAHRYGNSEIDAEALRNQFRMVSNLFESWPEGIRAEILEAVYVEDLENGDPSISKIIHDAIDAGTIRPEDMFSIEDFTDIPVEMRNQLKKLEDDSWKGRIYLDEQVQENVLEGDD